MLITENLPYTVYQDEEDEHLFHMEGPKIEKMLGYTNLDSEKGFSFFQRFLKDSGILEDLEKAGIQEAIPSVCMDLILIIINKTRKGKII